MTNSFVNMKSWKKSRYMLPKTVFVAATFCMLYMAYNPSASSSSKGLSSKQGPLSMSQAELDSLYKGHRSVFVNFCPVLVEFKDREAFRTLVESLVQMTPFISQIFLKLVELQFKVPISAEITCFIS